MPASRLFVLLAFVASSSLALEPDEIYTRISPSIVVIAELSDSAMGSGVIISPGRIITNCHVVNGGGPIFVKRGSFVSEADLEIEDIERDLCQLVAVEKTGLDRAISDFVPASELRVGQKVYALGAPGGLELTLSDGLISSIRRLDMGIVIQTTAPISPGSSGGGLFDSEGRLIGITTFQFVKGQNLNFALPTDWIDELQERHQVRSSLAREAAERARKEAEELRRDEAMRLAEEIRLEEEAERQRQFREEQFERERAAAQEAEQQRQIEEATRIEEAIGDPELVPETLRYLGRIREKIRARIVLPNGSVGASQGVYKVTILPNGGVFEAALTQSSGVSAYDEAVRRGIFAAQPLPVPEDPRVFAGLRTFDLRFKPEQVTANYEETIARAAIPPVASYSQQLSSAIRRYQKYPPIARRRGWEGVAEVVLKVSPEGRVVSIALARSSGREILDKEAVECVRRAVPLPAPPSELRGQELTITVPIVFRLLDS